MTDEILDDVSLEADSAETAIPEEVAYGALVADYTSDGGGHSVPLQQQGLFL